MKITRVVTEHLRVPLPKRGKVSLVEAHRPAGPDAVEVVLVRLETDAGLSGIGLTYLFGTGAKLVRQLLETELSPLVVGEWCHDTERLFAKAESHFRNVGFAGLPSRAYAAIDVALWDLKAKSANVSLGICWAACGPSRRTFCPRLSARVGIPPTWRNWRKLP